mmetsp:Transcript_23890/g.37459  ORF Transcript_23890/g.37459 Transcript_23890/m.37459 type:complete len:872 (+) Transcript_23890:92-2707(+)
MFVALSSLATILALVQAKDLLPSSSLLLESNGKLMRKELEVKASRYGKRTANSSSVYTPPNFGPAPAPTAKIIQPPREDIFDICLESTCTGNWNYYFLDHTPMTYRHCSNTCREVPECIGFDWHFASCRLFTQKAVDTRRWRVLFNETTGGPYGGDGIYVNETSQLGVLTEELNDEQEKEGCYLRKNPLASHAHYRKIGDNGCAGEAGTTLKRYVLSVEDHVECEDACNKHDECIALDFLGGDSVDGSSGSGGVDAVDLPGAGGDTLAQIDKSATFGTCHLYTQKPVANWYDLAVTFEDGGDSAEFVNNTHVVELSSASGNCSVKREYYSVSDYYLKLSGSELCQNWNHYTSDTTDVQHCEVKCDEEPECVGFDFNGAQCRLYSTEALASHGTMAAGTDYQQFAGDPDKLAVLLGANAANSGVSANPDMGCYKKTHYQTFGSFEHVGPNRCNGGGYWNYYQLSKAAASYVDCSSACLGRDACVGFDVGQGVCFLYAQYAVAEGSWPDVLFENGGAFIGGKVSTAHPSNAHLHVTKGYPTHNELTMEGRNASLDHMYQCYKKKIVPARDGRFTLAGDGTCSKDGLWARYPMVAASDEFNLTELTKAEACAVCFDACNKKDECVGIDCGKWKVEDESAQVRLETVQTIKKFEFGCNMYAQKPVWDWKLVEAEHAGSNPRPMSGTGSHEDLRPADPHQLEALSGVYSRYEVDPGDTQCWRKNAWVPLDEYYVHIPNRKCATLRHYKFSKEGSTTESLTAACKEKCDMWVSCVGLDVASNECRLFVTHAITGAWEDVEKEGISGSGGSDGSGGSGGSSERAFLGVPAESGKDEEFFAESGNDLGRRLDDVTIAAGDCYVKTHWHSRDEALDDGES